MLRKTLKIAGTASAMLIAAPLFAQAHGGGMGHAGGMPGGSMGGMVGGSLPGGAMGGLGMGVMHSQGPTQASPVGVSHANQNSVLVRSTTASPAMIGAHPSATVRTSGTASYSSRSQATLHSRALLHASPTAIAHASANSVLARGAVSTTTLTGIATGQTVTNASGTLGTVRKIIYGPNNTTIRAVVVTGANGQTYTLPANSFTTVNGGLMTTYGG